MDPDASLVDAAESRRKCGAFALFGIAVSGGKARQMEEFEFDAELWLYPGKGGWHFVTLPADIAGQIKFLAEPKKRGWRSEAVNVSTGRTEWTTSIFPDKASGSFLLPVKAEVRQKEKLAAGQSIRIKLSLDDA
ncbi:hypothetical protein ABIE78_004049 [Sinorhizobium fredii]|uniref:DUF1905 domain-containing protein n=1 Tax=Sinorhizobium fredii (strain USDA 257) TaxID=1185652 RepID=I3X2Q2_SINF2|nr:DUF1905 domain-containing protein [Sinorhizobium fredii]AFL50158.1 hypothetical protein USDA257_c15680 [Sinorhizobium fredii USDA 257]